MEAPPSYVEVVGASEEAVAKPLQAVTAGVSGIVEKVQQVRWWRWCWEGLGPCFFIQQVRCW